LDFMSEIYTPLEEAKEEIWRRWNDKGLQDKVEKYIEEVPEIFKKEPRSVLVRNITTPNMDFFHFLNVAGQVNLKPLCHEYLEDKFVTINHDKFALCKMPFQCRDKNGKTRINYRRIINFDKAENKKFSEIKTSWGENIIDFHHRIVRLYAPEVDIFDLSSWYKCNGKKASEYYQYFLAFFICNGILFENFVTDKHEAKFACEVVYPSFKKVEKLFGLKPLIVPLIPEDRITDIYWWCYPDCIRKEIEDSYNGHRRK